MPTPDAILAAVFLWGLVALASWLLVRCVLRCHWLVALLPVLATLIFVTAAMLS